MKILGVFIGFVCCTQFATAQYEETTKTWKVIPELMIVRYLPGEDFSSSWSPFYGSVGGYQYSGFGGSLLVRFMNVNLPGLAFTISGGATSFYRPEYGTVVPAYVDMPGWSQLLSTSTLGGDPRMRDFFVFPVSLGFQAVWPFEKMDKFRFFAGAEVAAYFVDGSIAPHAQTRFGYSVVGGFGVGIVELGARYSEFADMKNIGVFLGFCLKSYEF